MNEPRRRNRLRHGLHTMQKAVTLLGSRALPARSTALGRALHEWRASLLEDLGGKDAVSTQQVALVELAVRTKLLVDSVDAYVLGMPSPVNKRRRCLHPVVRERQSLVNQLQSLLRDLGLERRAQQVDVVAQLQALHAASPSPPGDAPGVRSVESVESPPAEGGGDLPSRATADNGPDRGPVRTSDQGEGSRAVEEPEPSEAPPDAPEDVAPGRSAGSTASGTGWSRSPASRTS